MNRKMILKIGANLAQFEAKFDAAETQLHRKHSGEPPDLLGLSVLSLDKVCSHSPRFEMKRRMVSVMSWKTRFTHCCGKLTGLYTKRGQIWA